MCDRWKWRRLYLTRLAKIGGSSFHRQGAAYRKERLVIFKEDRVGGRARVTIDEERVVIRLNKSWRYLSWFVVRTLYVREREFISCWPQQLQLTLVQWSMVLLSSAFGRIRCHGSSACVAVSPSQLIYYFMCESRRAQFWDKFYLSCMLKMLFRWSKAYGLSLE